MPKRSDIQSVLIIGAGPIVIGQACEFDYSGAQACKALREEGYRVILVNSNPATIMTDPQMADAVYIEPINWQTVERIIAKERPDAVLPTMGGQTALNCALDLADHGVLEKYGVELIGAKRDAIRMAEDRELFKQAMTEIGLESPKSDVAKSFEHAQEIQVRLGFPVIIRPSFTLGGTGGGIAYNKEEFEAIVRRGLEMSPTHEVLIDESVLGWKEFEMEVVRDTADNCIIVCAIENLDPMGVHTGDSITVAPAQTLTDKEYQRLRDASIAVLRKIGVDTGGSNVQFGINPADGRVVVIEMNPRVSRSSALASKATGFPIAKVAAKLAVGYTLDELQERHHRRATPASFEPTIDYVVTKIPRFAFEKFPRADARLTTQMKSVGEVMAIGRTFQESLQKALRGLEIGKTGLNPTGLDSPRKRAWPRSSASCASRARSALFHVADAFRAGLSLEDVHELSRDRPMVPRRRSRTSSLAEAAVEAQGIAALDARACATQAHGLLRCAPGRAARFGRGRRAPPAHDAGRAPGVQARGLLRRRVRHHHRLHVFHLRGGVRGHPTDREKIIVLGGGPTASARASSSTTAACTRRWRCARTAIETIMVNCNPETVSTDYDTSDRLYFEPLTLEDVLEIVELEKPRGVIVQYGGQTPLKLARALEAAGAPIIGTSPDSIDLAEDRERFQQHGPDAGSAPAAQPHRAQRRGRRWRWRARSAIRWWCALATCWAAARWKIVYERRDPARYMREAVQGLATTRRCCWIASSTTRSRWTWT
jgi:carbamoyl-phosphate synthase large subunit